MNKVDYYCFFLWGSCSASNFEPESDTVRGAEVLLINKGAITSKIKHAIKHGRYAVIGCKLKQNANEGCNSCASHAGLVLCFTVYCSCLL